MAGLMDNIKDKMGGMSDEAKERMAILRSKEKEGTLTEAGRMELQELRDRYEHHDKQ